MKLKFYLVIVLVAAGSYSIFEPSLTSANYGTGNAVTIDSKQVAIVDWYTVVNTLDLIPGSTLTFGSFGQPSVNTRGMVVFRARSVGTSNRVTGIYAKDVKKGSVFSVADINSFVPFPNNLETEFVEFPSIPRISMNAENIATRGNHQPVFRYFLEDGTETRAGTNGIYAKLDKGSLVTGMSKLGIVPGFENYAIPGSDPYLQFDVFPGSPAFTDDGIIVFKGNYTVDGVGRTGVFYRQLLDTPGGGPLPVEAIARSEMQIPDTPPVAGFQKFGSTAPPTVAGKNVVFVGLDNEGNPTYGGIYIAPILPNPPLTTLVAIGQPLNGLQIPGLNRIGEALSFDGRYLAFWGAWGTETKTVRLYCPTEGNKMRIAYCKGTDPNSIFDPVAEAWYQEKQVPVNQGIFVLDVNTGIAYLASDTVSEFADFIYWNYSGSVPGMGHSEEEGEPARWRGTAFLSVSDGLVAFKARSGDLDAKNVYIDTTDGIYLTNIAKKGDFQVLAETGMDAANLFDPDLQPGQMSVTELAIEREGFRGKYLVIAATMGDAEETRGGIYALEIKSKIVKDK